MRKASSLLCQSVSVYAKRSNSVTASDKMSNAQSGGTTFGLPGGRMTLQFFRAIVGRHRE